MKKLQSLAKCRETWKLIHQVPKAVCPDSSELSWLQLPRPRLSTSIHCGEGTSTVFQTTVRNIILTVLTSIVQMSSKVHVTYSTCKIQRLHITAPKNVRMNRNNWMSMQVLWRRSRRLRLKSAFSRQPTFPKTFECRFDVHIVKTVWIQLKRYHTAEINPINQPSTKGSDHARPGLRLWCQCFD